MMAYTEVTFDPETFIVNASETAKRNKNFVVTISVTAINVSKTTIRRDDTGAVYDLSPSNSKAVEAGITDKYSYSKVFRVASGGTYTFTITVYGKNGGAAVKTATVVVK